MLAYALLGLPLAMAALPIYVIAPDYYGRELGLDLALLGTVVFLARLVDTAQDPFIGGWVAASQERPGGWAKLMVGGGVLTGLGFGMLFQPPELTAGLLAAWLALSMVLVYTGHSLMNICYLTWGARLSDDTIDRARVTAWREGAGLAGVVLASLLPVALAYRYGSSQGYALFVLVFILILAATLTLLLRRAPRPIPTPPSTEASAGWRQALRPKAIRQLVLVYALNALAVSIPATLVLFYVSDVLGEPDARKGQFLAAYFLAGAATLPLWVRLSARFGKAPAWLLGMVLGCLAFVWASGLGPGDGTAFLWVCVLSGMALGADLALPPALLADIIPPHLRRETGLYFGIWALISKLALAASGLAFPLLAALGYQPGLREGAAALAMVYAGIPCGLKILTAALLLLWYRHWPVLEADSPSPERAS